MLTGLPFQFLLIPVNGSPTGGGFGIHVENPEGTAWNHDKLVYIGNPVTRKYGEIRPWGDPPIGISKQRLSNMRWVHICLVC